MGKILDERKYPVIDEEPSVGKVIRYFRGEDWRNLALITGVSFPFGYWAGRPVVMYPTMYTAAGLGALAGVMFGMQSSFFRLAGYKENSVECAKAGIPSS